MSVATSEIGTFLDLTGYPAYVCSRGRTDARAAQVLRVLTVCDIAAADIHVDHSGRAAVPNLRRILLAGAAEEWARLSTNGHPANGLELKLHL